MCSKMVAAVRGRAAAYVDGGARRGTDAAIALALRANAIASVRWTFATRARDAPGIWASCAWSSDRLS